MEEQRLQELFHISALIIQRIRGIISAEQDMELQSWIDKSEENRSFFDEMLDEELSRREVGTFSKYNSLAAYETVRQKIPSFSTVDLPYQGSVRKLYKPYIWAAASVALICVLGIFINSLLNKGGDLENAVLKNNIKPGADKAVLTLADGSQVVLDDVRSDTVALLDNMMVRKAEDGTLVYQSMGAAGEEGYNTILTPKGGKYQVVLSDGTKVWLNAASSIRFPVSFNPDRRQVEITGEAYFEVAKIPARKHRRTDNETEGVSKERVPFLVQSGAQLVKVLGTHFNINAYRDEDAVRTTLLEGSVDVLAGEDEALLRPGQQSVNRKGALSINAADTETAVAWKEGFFQFNEEHLETILRQVARWYDVEIDCPAEFRKERFSGTVSRYGSVADVLRIMEETGVVHFEIKERRIIVSR